MFLHGIKFKVITDHQPLVVLHSNPGNREMPFRGEKHRMKVQEFDFLAEYREGKVTPMITTADMHSRTRYQTSKMKMMMKSSMLMQS